MLRGVRIERNHLTAWVALQNHNHRARTDTQLATYHFILGKTWMRPEIQVDVCAEAPFINGKANFLAIVDALVENPATTVISEQTKAIRTARDAALADPEGKALGSTLGKPVVWMKPVKSA